MGSAIIRGRGINPTRRGRPGRSTAFRLREESASSVLQHRAPRWVSLGSLPRRKSASKLMDGFVGSPSSRVVCTLSPTPFGTLVHPYSGHRSGGGLRPPFSLPRFRGSHLSAGSLFSQGSCPWYYPGPHTKGWDSFECTPSCQGSILRSHLSGPVGKGPVSPLPLLFLPLVGGR